VRVGWGQIVGLQTQQSSFTAFGQRYRMVRTWFQILNRERLEKVRLLQNECGGVCREQLGSKGKNLPAGNGASSFFRNKAV
jgi:hypothetical protein